MTIVKRPYLLDIASAYPEHRAPEFPPEIMEEWTLEKIDQFGDRWPQVERLLYEVQRRLGIVLTDIHPGNITFA